MTPPWSSSRAVSTAVAFGPSRAPPVGAPRASSTVRLPCTRALLRSGTLTIVVGVLAGKVSTVETGVKSSPAAAVPGRAVKVTLAGVVSAPVRTTVMTAGVPSRPVKSGRWNWIADSSSTIVTVAANGATRAAPPRTLPSVIFNVSLPSTCRSWKIGSRIVALSWLAPKDRVPLTAP
jgi:hypothetical protein